MPYSNPEGSEWLRERIATTSVSTIVDIGPGAGMYSKLARADKPDANWVAVEIFEPYVEQFDLTSLYDTVLVQDARKYVFPEEPFLLIAGDVIEHMQYDEALYFLMRAKRYASAIAVSLPIVYYPQGEVNGNPCEAHLYHWGYEEMKAQLPGCQSWKGEEIGRYWWER